MSGSVMEGAILMQGLVTGGSGFVGMRAVQQLLEMDFPQDRADATIADQLSAAGDQGSVPVQEPAHA